MSNFPPAFKGLHPDFAPALGAELEEELREAEEQTEPEHHLELDTKSVVHKNTTVSNHIDRNLLVKTTTNSTQTTLSDMIDPK